MVCVEGGGGGGSEGGGEVEVWSKYSYIALIHSFIRLTRTDPNLQTSIRDMIFCTPGLYAWNRDELKKNKIAL